MPAVALSHDYLREYGGAERVLAALADIWPAAPIVTSVHDPAALPAGFLSGAEVRASFMQRLPWQRKLWSAYVLLCPLAFAVADVHGYDTLVSSASFAAKAVRPQRDAAHVCYCHTPPRFLWGYESAHDRSLLPPAARAILRVVEAALRRQDYVAAQAVDVFVANSQTVRARIRRCYGRESTVVYPPVDTVAWATVAPHSGDYFLMVSRPGRYKRLDLAVDACRQAGARLHVVGTTAAEAAAIGVAGGDHVHYIGRASEADLRREYAGALAALYPGEDDFGIVPVEAMAAGKPVLAYGAGGALETVLPGVTGELFHPQTPEALAALLRTFHAGDYDSATCRDRARAFSREAFDAGMRSIVSTLSSGPASG